jgi:hypothetical protein
LSCGVALTATPATNWPGSGMLVDAVCVLSAPPDANDEARIASIGVPAGIAAPSGMGVLRPVAICVPANVPSVTSTVWSVMYRAPIEKRSFALTRIPKCAPTWLPLPVIFTSAKSVPAGTPIRAKVNGVPGIGSVERSTR